MATSVPCRARSVCFTLNNYTESEVEAIRVLASKSKYLVFGYEEAPTTGTKHIQGFVSFQNPRSIKEIKKEISERVHLEVAKGSATQNRVYCTKDGKYEEFGELPTPGKRSDWTQAVEDLQSGVSVDQVISTFPHMLPAQRALREFKNLLLKPKHREVNVIVLYGEAGTGKSRYAYEKYPELYSKPRGDWWDGYTGQSTILLDDYYGYLSYSELLRVLDRYPYNAQIKGGFVWAQWDTVVITSNKPPSKWYSQGLTPALRRRLNKVFYVSSIDGVSAFQEDNEEAKQEDVAPPASCSPIQEVQSA